MRRAGRVVAEMHARTREVARPGATTGDIDRAAREVLAARGAKSNFLNYGRPPFPAVVCTSVNDVVVHGIPSDEVVLADGDLLSIDCGAIIEGYHGDAAFSMIVGDPAAAPPEAARLIEVGEEALAAAIRTMVDGARLSDIGATVQTVIEDAGFEVTRDYGGHGIGTAMHEDPHVPNLGPPGKGMKLRPGMVFAIEPMLQVGGRGRTRTLDDQWTVVTIDGSLACHTEHTIVVTEHGPEILTLP